MIAATVLIVGGTMVLTGAAMNCHIRSSVERGFVNIGGGIYYYDDNGNEAYGFTDIDGNCYYFSIADHRMVKGMVDSLVCDSCYYFNEQTGSMQTGFINIDGNDYYFDPDTGLMAKGWTTIDGKEIYLDEVTGICAKGRVFIGEDEYYIDDSYNTVKGWFELDGQKYHSSTDTGIIDKGITDIDGSTYYLDADTGAMRTGWIEEGSEKYYFMTDTGVAAEGMMQFGDTIYGFQNGLLLKDAKVVQGRTLYYIGSDGLVTRTVDGNRPLVALTFDDGPSQYTEQLVSILEANNARATFFVVGNRVDWYPGTLRHAVEIGCEMGNHTYAHTYLDKASPEEVANVIGSTDAELLDATGIGSTCLRPPGGRIDDTLKTEVSLPIILWSIDTRDWATRDVDSTINAVIGHVRDGDVILMHDIYEPTVIACETIIPKLKEQGFELVTVEELGLINRGGLNNGQVYYSIRQPD